jgi:glycosyltransferase involved in cell wall biosynthesis
MSAREFTAYDKSIVIVTESRRKNAPQRVVHIVENLDRGSVEAWLLRMLAHARAKSVEVDWTFYCVLGKVGRKDDLARTLGARVVHSSVPISAKTKFIWGLRSELRSGAYDVMHAHHDLVSGMYVMASIGLPTLRRVIHVHNADEEVLTDRRLKKAILRPALRHACLALADRVAANSEHSLDTFLAGRPRRPGRDVVLSLGIDPGRFTLPNDERSRLREALGFDRDALILLFAGRMTPEKNPLFVVDVLGRLCELLPKAVAIFVGAGSLEESVRHRVEALGLTQKVRCLGWRDDVPEIMLACDWFILPHPEQPVEAFGIAVVEAQLAGLRMLLSRGILDAPILPTASFRRLALAAGPSEWARAAVDLLRAPAMSREAAIAALGNSPMDMDCALDGLLALYA